ncbi:type II secretion system GspH family protein [Thiotrichales bacterium 19S11-10]|nr:type II secretion system GspH family protein [Thiotrichales bacterium 19S11-10]
MKHQSGITLIETLVVFGLLSLATIMLVMLVSHSSQSLYYVKEHQNAKSLAQDKIELLSNELNQKNLTPIGYKEIASGDDNITLDHTKFKRKWIIENYKKPFQFKKIQVTVSWIDREQKKRMVSFDSLITDKPERLSGKILLPAQN